MQALLLVLARLLTYGVGAATTVATARLLGPASFGVLAAASAVAALPLLFGPAGIDQLMLFDELPLAHAHRAMLRVGSATAVAAVVVIAAWPNLSSASRLCAAALSGAAILRILTIPWLLEPQRQMRFATRARRELVSGSLTSLIIVLAAISRSALMTAVAGLASWLVVCWMSGALRRQVEAVRIHLAPLAEHFRRSWPYAISAASYTIYFTVDSAILAAVRPSVEVGHYRAAYAVLSAALVLPVVLNNDILRARLAATASLPQRSAVKLLTRFGVLSAGLGLLVGVLVYLLARLVIISLYGAAFAPAVPFLKVLALVAVPYFLTSWAANGLVGIGRIRTVLSVQLVLLLANVAANVALLPTGGPIMAARITLATEVAGVMAYGGLLAGAFLGSSRLNLTATEAG